MSKWKILVLALLLVICIVLIAVFWGSIFSIVLTMALIGAPGVYLYNRYLNSDQTSDFIDDQGGWN